MKIDINDITPCAWNPRGEITDKSVKELAASIAEQGLIQPIVVWKDADKNWVCIAGNRRLAAMKLAGLPLDAGDVIEFNGTEAEARQATITENLQREDVGIIEEAEAVCALLEMGMTDKAVAAKLGRSVGWVTHRRKLATLTDGWKERANDVDADALEKIAAFPAEIQNMALERLGDIKHWTSMRYCFEDFSRSLDMVKFDTKPCRKCAERTGALGDLFGDVKKGELGRCLNCKCFDKKRKEFTDALIKRELKGAKEVVRHTMAWQMPNENESTETPDKEHPCAHLFVNGDEVEVRFTASEAEKKAKENKTVDEEENAARKIFEKLNNWQQSGDVNEYPAGIEDIVKPLISPSASQEVREFSESAIADSIATWHSADSWAILLKVFPKIAELAGLTPDEVKDFIELYSSEEEDDGNENNEQ